MKMTLNDISGREKRMSLDDITPEQWDSLTKASKKKLDDATDEEWHEADRKSRGTWRETIPLADPVDWLDDFDPVEKPEHYNTGEIECIDYIKQQLGDDFYAYCEGNVLKYLHRYGYKNGLEDLHKARWYLDRLIRVLSDDRGNR